MKFRNLVIASLLLGINAPAVFADDTTTTTTDTTTTEVVTDTSTDTTDTTAEETVTEETSDTTDTTVTEDTTTDTTDATATTEVSSEITTLIDSLKDATPEERFEIMNQLKELISSLNEEDRAAAIALLRDSRPDGGEHGMHEHHGEHRPPMPPPSEGMQGDGEMGEGMMERSQEREMMQNFDSADMGMQQDSMMQQDRMQDQMMDRGGRH
ncbi:hypothetical protein [Sulfurimonas sp.]|uniref:hypothetical protein n=1 Tax=Sulfurimonas sp. TaxID=2022749 RepID=UPI003D1232EC